MYKKILLVFALLIAILSCKITRIPTQNITYLYDKDMLTFIPEYVVYFPDDTTTRLFFRYNSGNLLYVKPFDSENFKARFSIKAELYTDYDLKTLLDSGQVSGSDDNKTVKKDITGSIDLNHVKTGFSVLKVSLNDLNKKTSVESYINVYRSSPFSRQNFLLTDEIGTPLFSNYIGKNQEFILRTNNTNADKLFVRFYDRIFPLASVPFSSGPVKSFDYTADSLFTIPLNQGNTDKISLTRKGFYHFQTDTTTKEGFTLYKYYDNFPKVSSAEQMLLSLRYLTSKYEFDDLLVIKSRKEAVDKFWLENAGNEERAKEMIKLYYNRVQDANRCFTSYQEGWKTDRGIIFIIYGQPDIVYRGKDVETWVYGEDRNMLSITFTFYKMVNPFTDNDFSLSRSPAYKDGWYVALENWKR